MPEPEALSPLLTTAEAARLLGVDRRTLERWRVSGDGPPFIRVGGVRRYSVRDLTEWIEGQKARSTADLGAAHRMASATA